MKNQIKKFGIVLVCFISILGVSTSAYSQEKEHIIEIEMKDGSLVVGNLVEDNETEVILNTPSLGQVTIKKDNIKVYKKVTGNISNENGYWYEHPNASRNIFSPTGYGLRKGEGYYQNLMLFYNQVSYGFTDRFTLGVGVEIASLLVSASLREPIVPGFTLTPKFSIPIKENKWNVGVGALIVRAPASDGAADFSILYGVNTFGSRDRNVSFGIGYGLADGELASSPTFTFSGTIRVSPAFAFTTENYILPSRSGVNTINSFGGRYIGKKATWDFAISAGGNRRFYTVLPIPIVGMTIPFGKGWTK